MSKAKVLISDYANSEISGDIPYLFKKADCEVHVMCKKESWLLKNNNYDHWIKSDRRPENYAKNLENMAMTGRYAHIILTDDKSVRIANDHIQDAEIALKILPLSKIEHRKMLGSKAGLSLLCEKYGISTPRFEIYNESKDIDMLVKKMRFPLMLKVDRSGGGNGVIFCNNEESMRSSLNKLCEDEKQNLVLQEYIDGENISVEALYKDGFLLAYSHSKVLQNVDGEFSVSCVREYSSGKHIEEFLKKVGRDLGINGFGSITIMIDKRGTYFLIEADLRPQVWFRLAKFAGVDFSSAIRNYLLSEKILLRPKLSKENKIIIRHFSRDFLWCIKYRNLKGLGRWIFNLNHSWKFLPSYDRKIFFASLRIVVKSYLYWIYNKPNFAMAKNIYRKMKYGWV